MKKLDTYREINPISNVLKRFEGSYLEVMKNERN